MGVIIDLFSKDATKHGKKRYVFENNNDLIKRLSNCTLKRAQNNVEIIEDIMSLDEGRHLKTEDIILFRTYTEQLLDMRGIFQNYIADPVCEIWLSTSEFDSLLNAVSSELEELRMIVKARRVDKETALHYSVLENFYKKYEK